MIPLLLGFVLSPPWWAKYAVGGVLVALLGGYVYHLGYSSASSKCRAAELERVIYAQAESLARYRTSLEASASQREAEALAAKDRESILGARLAELEADAAAREKEAADLEADLRAAITDKGKADALVKKLHATRTDCRATDRDIDVDQRMRRKQ